MIDLLDSLQGQVSLISRLRLDTALYEAVPVRPAGQRGRKRLKGNRLPTLLAMAADKQTHRESLAVNEWYGGASQRLDYCTGTAVRYHSGKKPVAIRWVLVRLDRKLTGLVSNDTQLEAWQMIGYFVPHRRTGRWSIETTFALVRSHLGVETQRQWSPQAIARTTPVLLGLFSLITLLADSLAQQGVLVSQVSSWYVKAHPTFSDAIACVRAYLWRETNFCMSGNEMIRVKMSQHQYQLWQDALAWAA